MRYRVYGTTIESDHRFVAPLPRTAAAARLTVRFSVDSPPIAADTLLHESSARTGSGEPERRIFAAGSERLVRYTGIADYRVGAECIECALVDDDLLLAEIYLLGPVLSLWLESRGVLAMHAAALEIDGRAIALLADSGGGKSTLAGALLRGGAPLLTDDILAVELREGCAVGHSGYPQMRMWPEIAAGLWSTARPLQRVHPRHSKLRIPVGGAGVGRFRSTSLPIHRFYVLDRRAGHHARIEIAPLAPSAALIEIVRNSFSAPTLEALRMQEHRLPLLAALLDAVPVRRLTYPSGRDWLDRVTDALREDAAQAGPRPAVR